MSDACSSLCIYLNKTVLNVSVHQLQQHTIEICCKMIQLPYQWTREANRSFCVVDKMVFYLSIMLVSFGMCVW